MIFDAIRSIPFLCVFLTAAIANGAETRTEPLEGPAAEVELFEHYETDTFQLGVKLYTNRDYVLKEAPEYLLGKPFARNAMEWTGFRCTKAGIITLLTPDTCRPEGVQSPRTTGEGGVHPYRTGQGVSAFR